MQTFLLTNCNFSVIIIYQLCVNKPSYIEYQNLGIKVTCLPAGKSKIKKKEWICGPL